MKNIKATVLEALKPNAFQARRRMLSMKHQAAHASEFEGDPQLTQGQDFTHAIKTNTTNEAGDHAYSYLAKTAPRVYNFIKVDAHAPIDPVETIKLHSSLGKNEDATIATLKQHLNRGISDFYPGDYPIRESVKVSPTLITEALNMDLTWEKYGEKVSHRLYDEGLLEGDKHKQIFHQKLLQTDPTEHKEYAPWIAAKYANGGMSHSVNPHTGEEEHREKPGINRLEDFGRVREALTAFHAGKTTRRLQGLGLSNDINTHKSLSSLEDAVDQLPKEESKNEQNRVVRDAQSTKHDSEHWLTIIPHTKEASILYGKGTRWCTAATNNNFFDSYNRSGPLYIMKPKAPEYPGEQYQFHMNTSGGGYPTLMDEKDRTASPDFSKRPNPVVQAVMNDKIFKMPVKQQVAAAVSGPDDVRDKLLNVRNDEVQDALYRHGNETHRAAIEKSAWKSSNIKQMMLATKKPEHLSNLIDDSDPNVRAAVFEHGHEEHRNILLNDPSIEVQKSIIKHGTQEQRYKIASNPNLKTELVHELINTKDPEYLNRFITHEDPLTRALVAQNGTKEHLDILEKDPSFLVKHTVKDTKKVRNIQ